MSSGSDANMADPCPRVPPSSCRKFWRTKLENSLHSHQISSKFILNLIFLAPKCWFCIRFAARRYSGMGGRQARHEVIIWKIFKFLSQTIKIASISTIVSKQKKLGWVRDGDGLLAESEWNGHGSRSLEHLLSCREHFGHGDGWIFSGRLQRQHHRIYLGRVQNFALERRFKINSCSWFEFVAPSAWNSSIKQALFHAFERVEHFS